MAQARAGGCRSVVRTERLPIRETFTSLRKHYCHQDNLKKGVLAETDNLALGCKIRAEKLFAALMTLEATLQKGGPFFDYQKIEDLEEELVSALYAQRALEERISPYKPQSSAPGVLIQSFIDSKKKVQGIEMEIRCLRYSF